MSQNNKLKKEVLFLCTYSNKEVKPIYARNRTIANAIARLYADGRKYILVQKEFIIP